MRRRTPARTRGVSLIDALVALLILSLGMLAMTRLQARVFAQSGEARNRLLATRLSDELLDRALIDSPINAQCYTVPASGSCPVAAASTETANWLAAVSSSGLPLRNSTPRVTFANNTLTVTIEWSGRVVSEGVPAVAHQVTRSTDVR